MRYFLMIFVLFCPFLLVASKDVNPIGIGEKMDVDDASEAFMWAGAEVGAAAAVVILAYMTSPETCKGPSRFHRTVPTTNLGLALGTGAGLGLGWMAGYPRQGACLGAGAGAVAGASKTDHFHRGSLIAFPIGAVYGAFVGGFAGLCVGGIYMIGRGIIQSRGCSNS